MKRLLPFLAPLLLLALAPLWMGGNIAGLLGGSPPSVGGPSYDILEEFGAVPASATITGTTFNWNVTSSPTPASGAACMSVQSSGSPDWIEPFTAADEAWLCVRVQFSADPEGSKINFRDGSGNVLGYCGFRPGGLVRVFNTGGSSSDSVSGMTTGVWYWVWMHYVKGTGGNSVFSVGWSADGTRPTSGNQFVSSSNGTSTVQAAQFYYLHSTSNHAEYYDRLIVRTGATPIPDNP